MHSPRYSSIGSSIDTKGSAATDDFHHHNHSSQFPHSNRPPSLVEVDSSAGETPNTSGVHYSQIHPPRLLGSEASSRLFNSNPSLQSTRSSARSTSTADNVFVNNFRFNQDGSCFAASTTEGFRVFTCSPLSEFARREHNNYQLGTPIDPCGDGRINLVAMLYRSHSFAFVTHKEPKKVQLWNDREAKVVGTIRCRHAIRNVFLSREVIVVVTENAVYIYLAGTITPLHVLATGHNPHGLCAISSDANAPWTLACPTITPGAVRIQTSEAVDTVNKHAVGGNSAPRQSGIVFQTHQNPIGCLSLNPNGSIVGTASILGTVIKLFKSQDGVKLYELRLASVPHEIRGIAIRGDGQFVAATSNSMKIHIFKLDEKATSSTIRPSDGTPGCGSVGPPTEPPIVPLVSQSTTQPSASSTPRSSFPSDWDSHHPQPTELGWCPSPGFLASSHSNLSSSTFGTSSFGSLTSTIVNQSREFVTGTLKMALPKYFSPARSFAQLLLPVDPEVDVRSCSSAAVAQHYVSSCEDCRALLRQRGSLPLVLDAQLPTTPPVSSNRPRSSSGAARFVEGLGRSTSSFLSGASRHHSHDDSTSTTQRTICPCGFGSCWTSGPLVTFAGNRSNHFYVLHHDGFFYEARFDSQYGGQCQILSVSPWFAPRRDFNLQGSLASIEAPAIAVTPPLPRLSISSTDDGFSAVGQLTSSLSDLNPSNVEKIELGSNPIEETGVSTSDLDFHDSASLASEEVRPYETLIRRSTRVSVVNFGFQDYKKKSPINYPEYPMPQLDIHSEMEAKYLNTTQKEPLEMIARVQSSELILEGLESIDGSSAESPLILNEKTQSYDDNPQCEFSLKEAGVEDADCNIVLDTYTTAYSDRNGCKDSRSGTNSARDPKQTTTLTPSSDKRIKMSHRSSPSSSHQNIWNLNNTIDYNLGTKERNNGASGKVPRRSKQRKKEKY